MPDTEQTLWTEYQCYAFDRAGKIVWAAPRKFGRLGPSVIRRLVREHEEWADQRNRRSPDCPAARAGNRRQHTIYLNLIGAKHSRAYCAHTGRQLPGLFGVPGFASVPCSH